MDPYQFRLQNIYDDRPEHAWRDVLVGAAELRGLEAARRGVVNLSGERRAAAAASRLGRFGGSQAGVVGRHRGEQEDRQDPVEHVYAAQDAGLTVYPERRREPDRSATSSWARAASLLEAGRRSTRSASDEPRLGHYPILRFKDAPKVTPRSCSAPTSRRPASGEPPIAPVRRRSRTRSSTPRASASARRR